MSAENSEDLLQNADQLFDENKFQEAVDILKKHPVIIIFFSFTHWPVCHDRISFSFKIV